MARVYESLSSRAAKHAGTFIVHPVANRALPEQRRRLATKGTLARVLFQTMLERTSPLIRRSCSRFFISASIPGTISFIVFML